MKAETVSVLTELNRTFYSEFGESFAATRRRVQDGVQRALALIPDGGAWLDVGCGSGTLAAEWLRLGRASTYLGIDFSETLLREARQTVGDAAVGIRFARADLSDPAWAAGLEAGSFAGALAFAVLHHLPSLQLRERVLCQARDLLIPGGLLVHSQWQFQHSGKLMARRLPWEVAGLDVADLEPGDTLLDWRTPTGQGLRYVHLFDLEELNGLAARVGFNVRETYESDGYGGRLGLYQVWEKK